MALGVSIVSGKLPVRYSCASVSSRCCTRWRCRRDDLVDDEPQRLAGRLRARVGLGDDVARVLQRVEVGRRAVGQPALGAQDAVQPVARLRRRGSSSRCRAPGSRGAGAAGDVADADLGLDRAGPVDDHDAAGRRRRLVRLRLRQLDASPSCRTPARRPRTPPRASTSPTIARIALLAPNHRLWNASRSSRVIAASDAGVPESGLPYGWNP